MQAMRCIVKTFRRPPTGRIRGRNGGLQRLSDGVAHALRCPASPRRTLLAENPGKPSLWVMISAPWYYGQAGPPHPGRARLADAQGSESVFKGEATRFDWQHIIIIM